MRVVHWIVFVVLLVAGAGFLADTAMNSYFETETLTCTSSPFADESGRVNESCPQPDGPVGALIGIGLMVAAAAVGRPPAAVPGTRAQQPVQPAYPGQQAAHGYPSRPGQAPYQQAAQPHAQQPPQASWQAQTATPPAGLPAQYPQHGQPGHPGQPAQVPHSAPQQAQQPAYPGYPGQPQQPAHGATAAHPMTGPNPIAPGPSTGANPVVGHQPQSPEAQQQPESGQGSGHGGPQSS